MGAITSLETVPAPVGKASLQSKKATRQLKTSFQDRMLKTAKSITRILTRSFSKHDLALTINIADPKTADKMAKMTVNYDSGIGQGAGVTARFFEQLSNSVATDPQGWINKLQT